MLPRRRTPASFAAFATGSKRAMLSAMPQLMFFCENASLAAPKITIFVGLGLQCGFEAAQVRREHGIDRAVAAVDAGHDGGAVGHLRHPFRRYERGGFDVLQAGLRQPVDQFDLDLGRDEVLFVLQAVAGTDFDDLYLGRGHGLVSGVCFAVASDIQYPRSRSTMPLIGSPRSSAFIFRAICTMLSSRSVSAEMCGVIVMRGVRQNG